MKKELWWFDKKTLELVFDEWPGYRVDLERCGSSAKVLDWIIQVQKKTWATREVMGALVAQLERCLDLQGHVCGCGVDHKFGVKKWLRSSAFRKRYLLHSPEFDEFWKQWDRKSTRFIDFAEYAKAEEEFLKHVGFKG